LGSLFVFSPVHADLNTGLVAQYSFDDCTAKDNSGNGHDGTINGNPQCVDGVKGKAFSFDSDANYLKLNVSTADLFSNDFSIGTWVKFYNFQNSYPTIIQAENSNVSFSGLGSAYPTNIQKQIEFFQQNKDGYPISRTGQMNPSVKLEENKWYFATIVKAGLQFKMYLNSSVITTTTATKSIVMDGSFITVGASAYYPSSVMNGELDDLRIYNRALSEAEVTSLYNMGQLSGTVNGVQKYSAVCKNTKTSVTKKIAVADGAKEWNCKTAGLQTKKGDIVTVTITGVSQ
jgi:hypothetical protein